MKWHILYLYSVYFNTQGYPVMREPDKQILHEYYLLWKQGYSDSEIRDILNLSLTIHKENQPHYFNYCHIKMKEELAAGTFSMVLSENREEEFLDHVRAGMAYDKAARMMNIPIPTLLEVWFKDENFKAKVDFAREMATSKVVKALYKRALGYTARTKCVTTTVTKGRVDKEGAVLSDMTVESTTEREEHIAGAIDAQKFWLINTASEHWSVDGGTMKANNKGQILQAIEDMTTMTPEDVAELTPEEQERYEVKS